VQYGGLAVNEIRRRWGLPRGTDLAGLTPWKYPSDKLVSAERKAGMKQARFSEEQIIGVLKEAEAGAKVSELCRRHGISDATFYTWRSKYGGLEVSEMRRLRQLEEENR
jgi:putative transposase